MKRIFEYIWFILIALTLFAYILGYFKYISSLLVGVLLFTTFLKGQLIIDYFMGLKEVEGKYRWIPSICLATTLIFIAVAYYLPIT